MFAYTLVAASEPALGMVTVICQVTNSRVELDVAGATDSDSDPEADVAAAPLHRLLLADTQSTVACDVANETILDWNAAAVDDRSASTTAPANDQRKMRPSTALTLNDALKESAIPPVPITATATALGEGDGFGVATMKLLAGRETTRPNVNTGQHTVKFL